MSPWRPVTRDPIAARPDVSLVDPKPERLMSKSVLVYALVTAGGSYSALNMYASSQLSRFGGTERERTQGTILAVCNAALWAAFVIVGIVHALL